MLNKICRAWLLAMAVILLFTMGNTTITLAADKEAIRTAARSATSVQKTILTEAEKHLGTPYRFGARYGQTRTFDCSSFVKTVFSKVGIDLPRVSRQQAKEGTYVSKRNLKIGDLLFFTTPSSKGRIGHVGIYVGNGYMIHTYGEGGVKYTSIHKQWWSKRYVTARRVLPNK